MTLTVQINIIYEDSRVQFSSQCHPKRRPGWAVLGMTATEILRHVLCAVAHLSCVIRKYLCRCHTQRVPPILLWVWHWLQNIIGAGCRIWFYSHCHTQGRIGRALPANLSLGMTTTKILRHIFPWHSSLEHCFWRVSEEKLRGRAVRREDEHKVVIPFVTDPFDKNSLWDAPLSGQDLFLNSEQAWTTPADQGGCYLFFMLLRCSYNKYSLKLELGFLSSLKFYFYLKGSPPIFNL